jgi:hypothetical protein
MTDPAVPEHDRQDPQPLHGAHDAAALQTLKASLAQQQHQLADQLATTRESSGRQEAGQIPGTAATQEEVWTGLQSILASLAAAANLLKFSDPAPPAAVVAPITSDGMFSGDGRPDLFGIAMGVKPGQTVDLVTASPSQVVLQYTHSYSWELAAAGQFADRQCQRFGTHAALVSTASESVDRSVATFRCVCVVGRPTDGTVH